MSSKKKNIDTQKNNFFTPKSQEGFHPKKSMVSCRKQTLGAMPGPQYPYGLDGHHAGARVLVWYRWGPFQCSSIGLL